jgi:hypothetical protein
MRALSVDRITAPPERKERALKVALLAPPWIPVPPPAYGGIEAVVALLCEELVASGHDITLFAAPGSRSPAHVSSPLGGAHPNEIGASLYESDHVSCAYDEIERVGREGRPFDLVHDHSGFTAVALANRVAVPVVHTVHGPFNEATRPFYQRHAHKVDIVALSATQADSAPSGVRVGDVVPNPIRGLPAFLLCPLAAEQIRAVLGEPRLHRAIGVIYRPETERQSHWFAADLALQYDALIHIDSTRAVEPLERGGLWEAAEPPETYPTAL